MGVVTQNNKPSDVVCGNPYLGRSSLLTDHIIAVYFRHQYHMESVLEISLYIQATTLLRRSVGNFTVENVEAHLFSLILQSINGKDYCAEVVGFGVSYYSCHRFVEWSQCCMYLPQTAVQMYRLLCMMVRMLESCLLGVCCPHSNCWRRVFAKISHLHFVQRGLDTCCKLFAKPERIIRIQL